MFKLPLALNLEDIIITTHLADFHLSISIVHICMKYRGKITFGYQIIIVTDAKKRFSEKLTWAFKSGELKQEHISISFLTFTTFFTWNTIKNISFVTSRAIFTVCCINPVSVSLARFTICQAIYWCKTWWAICCINWKQNTVLLVIKIHTNKINTF